MSISSFNMFGRLILKWEHQSKYHSHTMCHKCNLAMSTKKSVAFECVKSRTIYTFFWKLVPWVYTSGSIAVSG